MRTVAIIVTAVGLVCSATYSAVAQQIVAEGAEPQVITEGYKFTEGPLWHPDGYLLFSDIPANTIYRWTPGGQAEVFANPSGNSNGIALDGRGNIVVVQHTGKLSMVSASGELQTIVERYNGNRLNSPNDLAIHSNGTIYFTDPPFGVSKEDKELQFSGVYMLTPDGTLTPFYKKFTQPNGVALSPDEKKLYVNNSGTGQIAVFRINNQGKPVNPQPFASVGPRSDQGAADGMKTDSQGRVYSTGPGGVFVFDANGEQIHKIEIDSRITNLAWGGEENQTLFMTAPSAVYSLQMAVKGK